MRDLFEDIQSGEYLRIDCGLDYANRRVICFGRLVEVNKNWVVLDNDGKTMDIELEAVFSVTVLEC